MDELIAFVTARLDEDEAAAQEAASRPLGPAWDDGTRHTAVARHINRHDPARVLREVAAKRAILAEHAPQTDGPATGCGRCDWDHYVICDNPRGCATLRALATIWSDHADYRPEWVPDA